LKPPNTLSNNNYGVSVAISSDTIAVGSDFEGSTQTTITNGTSASSDTSSSSSGAVYVYLRSGTTWAQQAYIKAPNNDSDDRLGTAVAISGNTLGATATQESSSQSTITNGSTASSDNSATNSGAAYVFLRTGTTWAQQAYLKAANVASNRRFGRSAAISGDTIAIGVPADPSNQSTITNGTTASSNTSSANSGAVFVYYRTGTNWAQQAYIKAPNVDTGDAYGTSVAIDGSRIVVGAPNEDSNQTTVTNGTTASSNTSSASAGAVYVITRAGTTWTQEAYVKPPNTGTTNSFGEAVAVSGTTLIAGSPGESSNQNTITNGATASSDTSMSGAGASYIFKTN
jgi:hypothetical protein